MLGDDIEITEMRVYYGRSVKQEYVKSFEFNHSINTRPPFTGPSTHINMGIYVDDQFRIRYVDGDKCYAVYHGMYNRGGSVREGHFTAKEIRWLAKFIESITDPA